MAFIQSIDTDDLTNPSSTRKYDLGSQYVDVSNSDAIKPEYVYVKAHGALTQYQPYQLSTSNTAGSEVISKAPATTDTFAAGDYAEVLNAGTGLKLDGGASGSTAEGAQSIGIASTATSGGSATIVLSGNKVKIAAS